LQSRRFPFRHAFRSIATTTTSTTGQFQFRVQPTLATRYRVKALAFTSRVVTFYVVNGYRQLGQRTCQTRPKRTVGGTYRKGELLHDPGATAQAEPHHGRDGAPPPAGIPRLAPARRSSARRGSRDTR
jgi:hypothetical protein